MVVHLRNYIKNPTQYFIQYPDTCTSKSVFKNSATPCFSTHFSVFGYWMKPCLSFFIYIVFKLVNYTWSCSQKPINENHLGQVDESWYHHVFIWGETCFSSQIKDLHFNSVLLINTTHGNNENTTVKTFHCCSIISYCFIWKDIMVLRFHLFLGVWNPWWNTLPHFLHITQKSL